MCSGEAEVQIRITDKNDNAPYFKKLTYNARVPENTDIGTIVISVTAEDKDKGMNLYYRCFKRPPYMSNFYPIMSYDTLLHDDGQTRYVRVFICVT